MAEEWGRPRTVWVSFFGVPWLPLGAAAEGMERQRFCWIGASWVAALLAGCALMTGVILWLLSLAGLHLVLLGLAVPLTIIVSRLIPWERGWVSPRSKRALPCSPSPQLAGLSCHLCNTKIVLASEGGWDPRGAPVCNNCCAGDSEPHF